MRSYQGRRVTVVGLARSGMAAARLLKNLGAIVFATDKDRTPKIEAAADQLRREGIEAELGGHTSVCVENKDLIVVSPGVRLDQAPATWAYERSIEVVSEIELAASVCPATIMAITGTNGKTTTTTLVGLVLKAAGTKAYTLGNIGTPFSGAVLNMYPQDAVALEVSSFQLEGIHAFKPRVAAILNVTPDHLDRYKDVAAYLEAKVRVTMNQGSGDTLVLNYRDPALRALTSRTKAKVVFFNKEPWEKAFNENQMAVIAIVGAMGVSRSVAEEVFRTFKGVEHRLEFVRDLDGVTYVNDSKATNIDSTIWALKNTKPPVVLIAGGREKGSDFSSILDLVKRTVRHAVLVGESKEKIAEAWKGHISFTVVTTFEEAVRTAQTTARTGEVVLFSPMCKSFDMFTDYEHRGRTFKELVNKL
jgi:UDP-N-acetylmuramoylalanine--D-glutamate ligase